MENLKIILTIGIPASGKSTWSKEFVRINNNYVRVCRDDYRLMLAQSNMLNPKGEKLVSRLVKSAISNAIDSKYNVIVDQTNVNIKYLDELVDFCQKLADVEFKIFDIPIELAIERDKKRGSAMVGEEIIRKMYKNYLDLCYSFNYDFSYRKKKSRIVTNIDWKPKNELPNAVIFDIDGTLAHINGRRDYFDWDQVDKDLVDERVRQTLDVHRYAGYHIIIVTGRDGSCEKLTKMWLAKNKIHYNHFFIRPAGDFRKDTVIKKEIFDKYINGKFNVLSVYEDRDRVVSMWREMGLKCFQVIDGNY